MNTNLTTVTQFSAILAATYALKSFYSTATVNDLRWILAPTTFLVETITEQSFTFESHAGYMSSDHTFLIAVSCSGVNFLMISFLVLTLGKLWRERKMSWAFLPIAAIVAYSTTLVANTVRIVIALQMHANNFHLAGFDAEELHRIEGIVIYFLFLFLLFIAGENWSEHGDRVASTIASRSRYLLIIYYAVTLGIPILRGGYIDPAFWKHATFVLVVPLLFVTPVWIYSVTARVRLRENT
jgi:exosortase K